MRPDSTPPDASLFPIAPAFTADLDAKALDEIVRAMRESQADADRTIFRFEDVDLYAIDGQIYRAIMNAIRTTGRDV